MVENLWAVGGNVAFVLIPLGRWRRAATGGLAASGRHRWLAKLIVDMSNIIIVAHVSCDFVCHFFLCVIFYALYNCTGYYWIQVQAIRCLVIDAFSLCLSRRPGKNCQRCWLYGSSSSRSSPDLVQTSNVEDLQGRKWTICYMYMQRSCAGRPSM